MLSLENRAHLVPCPIPGCHIQLPEDSFGEWGSDGFLMASFRSKVASFPQHEHSSVQFSFPVNGSFSQTFGRRGSVTLTAGNVTYIPSGETHGTRWIVPGEIITVNAEPVWCEENCDLAMAALRGTECKTVTDSALHGMVQRASALLSSRDRDDLYIGSVGVTVALGVFHHLGLRPRRDVPITSPGPLKRVVRWIDEHFGEKITLGTLASLAGCSPCHLIRLFESYLGTSPAKYLAERRLRRSRELLRMPNSDITDIALQCGFSSQSHFTRAFTRTYGEPPGVYRTKRRSIHLNFSSL